MSVDLDKFSSMVRLPAQHADDAGCKCMHCQIYEASVPFVSELRQLRKEVAAFRSLAAQVDKEVTGLRKLEVAVRKHVMEWNGHPATRSLLAALKALEAAREG